MKTILWTLHCAFSTNMSNFFLRIYSQFGSFSEFKANSALSPNVILSIYCFYRSSLYTLALLYKYKLTLVHKHKNFPLANTINPLSQILQRSYEEMPREVLISVKRDEYDQVVRGTFGLPGHRLLASENRSHLLVLIN